MKFIKKAAALFFCLALALSVMAISASADDDVELLGASTTYTLTFKVPDTKADYDVDNDDTPDYKIGEPGTIDIYLKASDAASDVNGLEFSLETLTGVNVTSITIGSNSREMSLTNGLYQYLEEYNDGDIPQITAPESGAGVKIGTINFTTTSVASMTSVVFTTSNAAVHDTSITGKTDITSVTPATISVHPDYTISLLTYGDDDENGIKNDTATAVKSGDDDLTYTYNVVDSLTATMTLPAQSLTYYDFEGWQIGGSGNSWGTGTIPASATDLASASSGAYATGMYGNVTLTAILNAKTYNVTYVAGTGATYTTPDPVTYTIESQVNPGTNPTRADGYSFDGWVASGSDNNWDTTAFYGSGLYSKTATAFPANGMHGDVTLTAEWTPTSYIATFVFADGTTSDEPVTYNASAAIEKANPTRAGWTFKGWTTETTTGGWTSANYGTTLAADDTNNGLGSAVTLTSFTAGQFGTVTLTATWEANPYTMTFVPGHADVTIENAGSADETTGNYSVDFKTDNIDTIKTVTASRDGYTFKGWKVTTAPTGLPENSTVDNAAAFTVGFYGNATVEAQWEINGAFAQIAYAFSDKQLTLVAINTTSDNTNTSAGNYTFGNETMYPVANRYAVLCDGIDSADGYVVYATLAANIATDADWKDSVSFTKGTAVTGPDYDGDVNGDDSIDVGDYGTAGTIMTNKSAYDTITVVQLLGIDMNDGEFPGEGTISMIGHINDLKAIMDAAAPTSNG